MKKTLFVVLAVAFLFAFAYPVMAQTETKAEVTPVIQSTEPSVGLKIVDAILVRPPCVIGATISTIAYLIIALPTHIMGYSEPLAAAMVDAPWHFVNGRELGQF